MSILFHCKTGLNYYSSNKLRSSIIVPLGFSKSPSKHTRKFPRKNGMLVKGERRRQVDSVASPYLMDTV